MNKYFWLIILIFLYNCSPVVEDFFESTELVSSKNEKIYINTVLWGVTSDYQATIISTDKNKLKNNRNDTIGTTRRFSPFIFNFKNDTLNLYFKEEITYKINEQFNTIHVNYIALDDSAYNVIYNNAYVNKGYFLVPKHKKTEYPSDMPKPPKSN